MKKWIKAFPKPWKSLFMFVMHQCLNFCNFEY